MGYLHSDEVTAIIPTPTLKSERQQVFLDSGSHHLKLKIFYVNCSTACPFSPTGFQGGEVLSAVLFD